jgi:uncharacterized membrane protein YfcA
LTAPFIETAALLAAGLAAGFINTMAGGGSLLTLPALMLAGLPADVANGSNRVSVVAQASSGCFAYHRAGHLPLRDAARIAALTVPGVVLGAVVSSRLPRYILEPTLLLLTVFAAAALLFSPNLLTATEGEVRRLRERPAGVVLMLVAGFYGGFVQAGVGFLLLMVLGGMLRYSGLQANAIKLACAGMFGAVALVVFALANQVSWLHGVVLSIGSVAGSQLGVRTALKVPPRALRWIVLVAVLVMTVSLVVRRLGASM